MLTIEERTKVRVLDSKDHKIKLGQKEKRDSVQMRLRARLTNNIIDQFSPQLRRILFEKSTAPKKQAELDGVELSDLNALTKVGERIKGFSWNGEQTGCTLLVDRGLGDNSNIELTGTVSALHFGLLDAGPVEADFTFTATPDDNLDDLTVGRLIKTKKSEIWVTLRPPKVDDTQPQLPQVQDQAQAKAPAGEQLTPEAALAGSAAAAAGGVTQAWPFPQSGATQTQVTVKKSRAAAH